MSKGRKTCKGCGSFNGPRAFNCKSCGQAFKMNKPKKRKRKEVVTDYTSLKKGDTIYVVGGSGPYYTGEDGEKQYMMDRGEYQVQGIKDDGILAYASNNGYNHIYMGEVQKSSTLESITKAPCKILLKN